MKINYSKKTPVILPLLVLITVLGCARTINVRKPEKYRTVFCEYAGMKGGTIHHENVTDKFVKGDGKKVWVCTEWFDLIPSSQYMVRWEWYNPSGQIIGSKTHRFIPPESHYKTCNNMSLDHKYNHPSGLWSVRIYVNDIFISEERFSVVDNQEE